MNDLHVADILRARPSLKERATSAARAASEAEQERRAMEEQDLVIEVCSFMRSEFQCSDAEVEDLNFERGSYNTDGTVRQVSWALDGFKFRAHFKEEKINEYQRNGSSHAIRDRVLKVMAQGRSGQSWIEVKDLASLGRVA